MRYKKKLLSFISIIIILLTCGCSYDEMILKKELNKRYDNYEIIESTHYWNTGGTNYVQGIVKINNNLYEIDVYMEGETNEYYESLAKEIDYNIEINEKQYSSSDNLFLIELPYYDDEGMKKQSNLLLFIEKDSDYLWYDSLCQIIEKLDDEYKTEKNYPRMSVYFTDYINYTKKEDYKLFLLLKDLAWNDNDKTRRLSKDLNVNNYFYIDRAYTEFDDEVERTNYLKQAIKEGIS